MECGPGFAAGLFWNYSRKLVLELGLSWFNHCSSCSGIESSRKPRARTFGESGHVS